MSVCTSCELDGAELLGLGGCAGSILEEVGWLSRRRLRCIEVRARGREQLGDP